MNRKRSVDAASLDDGKAQKKKKSDLNVALPAVALDVPSPSDPPGTVGSLQLLTYNNNRDTLPKLPEILDKSLSLIPFTHQGTLSGTTAEMARMSYERLEFLGDAYIELIASQVIFPLFPHFPAGKLSQKRQSMVNNETLADFSVAYGFDKRARLPKTLQMAQGMESTKTRTKILGDIFEAYVAAVILSDPGSGYQRVKAWLTELWAPALSTGNDAAVNMKSKVQLASKISGRGIKIAYQDEAQPGVFRKEGKILFQVGVYLSGWGCENTHLGSGKGWSKSEAGNRAAMQALSNPSIAKIVALKHEFDLKPTQAKNKGESLGMGGKS